MSGELLKKLKKNLELKKRRRIGELKKEENRHYWLLDLTGLAVVIGLFIFHFKLEFFCCYRCLVY